MSRERDQFESELSDLRKQHAYVESGHQCAVKERDDLTAEVRHGVVCQRCVNISRGHFLRIVIPHARVNVRFNFFINRVIKV